MVRGRIVGAPALVVEDRWVWPWAVIDTRAPVGFQVIAEGIAHTWDAAFDRVGHWLVLESETLISESGPADSDIRVVEGV